MTKSIPDSVGTDTNAASTEAVTKSNETRKEDVFTLTKAIGSWFVRRDNRFYVVENTSNSLSRDDVITISVNRFQKYFPNIELHKDLLSKTFDLALTRRGTAINHSVQVWNGSSECRPDVDRRTILNDGMVGLNSWKKPGYRNLLETDANMGPFLAFLTVMMPNKEDRENFLDWLSWCLQNEADKPGWSIFLYSSTKGTGNVRRQGFWVQRQRKLRESSAHLVGLIMRRVVCDASAVLRVSFV